MYFNTVLTDSAKLLKPLLVFSFVMLAILAGLTRMIQFRNHPVDVYCGWLLGAAIAVYLVTQSAGHQHFHISESFLSSLNFIVVIFTKTLFQCQQDEIITSAKLSKI